jgi:hypothetical protein
MPRTTNRATTIAFIRSGTSLTASITNWLSKTYIRTPRTRLRSLNTIHTVNKIGSPPCSCTPSKRIIIIRIRQSSNTVSTKACCPQDKLLKKSRFQPHFYHITNIWIELHSRKWTLQRNHSSRKATTAPTTRGSTSHRTSSSQHNR